MAINWEEENLPAILSIWYPGQAGGDAVADILFGDHNPSGKLPITFYKSLEDLPDFKSYDMENRTYKYFKGTPLFPFGHGLSYTNFTYKNFAVTKDVKAGKNIHVSVEVTNSGDLDGDEVVQLYLSLDQKMEATPIRSLVGFKRIHLKAGETKKVEFTIVPDKYAYINEKGLEEIREGTVTISIGGKQPSFSGIADASTTQVITEEVRIIQE